LIKLKLRAEQLKKISLLTQVGKDHKYQFLGYSLDLETSEFNDLFENGALLSKWYIQNITTLLIHYSLASQTPKTGKLVRFKDLPGGYAYERAFAQRAADPIAQAFGDNPEKLAEAAKLLGGKRLDYEEVSVVIPALEGIPILYILWTGQEFSASANVLFDESASCFLDTEALAGLGEITTQRLLKAHSILEEKTH